VLHFVVEVGGILAKVLLHILGRASTRNIRSDTVVRLLLLNLCVRQLRRVSKVFEHLTVGVRSTDLVRVEDGRVLVALVPLRVLVLRPLGLLLLLVAELRHFLQTHLQGVLPTVGLANVQVLHSRALEDAFTCDSVHASAAVAAV